MRIANGVESWETFLNSIEVKNFGYGWDRVENVLWRVYHGELDGFEADQIIMKISTNNLHINSDDEIIEGLRFLIDAIKLRQPKAKITLLGILPRRDNEEKVELLNSKIQQATIEFQVNYLSVGHVLLAQDNKIDERLFRDGLHPNKKGYERLAPLINSYLIKE